MNHVLSSCSCSPPVNLCILCFLWSRIPLIHLSAGTSGIYTLKENWLSSRNMCQHTTCLCQLTYTLQHVFCLCLYSTFADNGCRSPSFLLCLLFPAPSILPSLARSFPLSLQMGEKWTCRVCGFGFYQVSKLWGGSAALSAAARILRYEFMSPVRWRRRGEKEGWGGGTWGCVVISGRYYIVGV